MGFRDVHSDDAVTGVMCGTALVSFDGLGYPFDTLVLFDVVDVAAGNVIRACLCNVGVGLGHVQCLKYRPADRVRRPGFHTAIASRNSANERCTWFLRSKSPPLTCERMAAS